MSETVENLLQKKLNRWGIGNADNFKEEKELTVEITLSEYRELIKDVATSKYQIDKLNEQIRILENTNKSLKVKNNNLTQILKEAQNKNKESEEK